MLGVCPSTGECLNLISEGPETRGTSQGRFPSYQECAQRLGMVPSERGVCPSNRNVRPSSRRELRLQAPPRGGCPAIRSVPDDQGICPANRECNHPLGSIRTSSRRKLRLEAPTRGGCPATGSVPSSQRVCPPTGECLHLILEGTDTTVKRKSANQGRLCVHTHSPGKAYHKKKSR